MKKTIVVTGATGFVGKKLCLELVRKNYSVRVITRNAKRAAKELPLPVTFHEWDGHSAFPIEYVEGADGVIHLAGEPIADNRWNAQVKKAILDSREKSTELIMKALSIAKSGPSVVVGTSAIGIYGDRASEVLTESSRHGQGFLTEVCEKWEKAYSSFTGRLAILRVGVVLGHGGALDKMLPPFRMGVGGILASGKQWMSWIHRDDLVQMYIHSLEQSHVKGAFNAVAPNPVTNSDFTKSMGKALNRPTLFPVPGFVIKLIFGERSQVLLGSQRVSAKLIEESGFKFKFPTVDLAFNDILRPLGLAGSHVLETFQWIGQPRTEVFPFFAEAQNLQKITPEWLSFKIKNLPKDGIKEGALIDYTISLKGLPMTWRTLISRWSPMEVFVDEQLKGPYQIWHHTHSFEDSFGGTLMQDRVVYKVPMGAIGEIVRMVMIKRDLKKIFNYRTEEIERRFPTAISHA